MCHQYVWAKFRGINLHNWPFRGKTICTNCPHRHSRSAILKHTETFRLLLFNRLFVGDDSKDRVDVTPDGDLTIDPVAFQDANRFACWVNRKNRAIYTLGMWMDIKSHGNCVYAWPLCNVNRIDQAEYMLRCWNIWYFPWHVSDCARAAHY